MRIVHISHHTPSRNAKGGGHVFMWQNIVALAELGHEVHLVISHPDEPLDDDLKEVAASVTYGVPLAPNPRSLDWILARVFRPETMMFRFPDWSGVRPQVAAALERIGPDLIWADWIGCLNAVPRGVPVVYGHLDFIHLLQDVRRRLSRRLRRPDVLTREQLKEVELSLVRSASFVVSVSATDVEFIEASTNTPCCYMPVVGQRITRPWAPLPPRARAFLLGRSNTAMNASRENLRRRIWPALGADSELLEWHQVGAPPRGGGEGWRWVEERFRIHGFVADLGEVLRPSDLCLVPYRDHTGFRAKFVTAAGHGMVNIGYEETFEVAEEFVPGENCLAARDDEHFAELLREYAGDRALRERLSEASRALYEARFSLESHLPVYRQVLARALARPPQ